LRLLNICPGLSVVLGIPRIRTIHGRKETPVVVHSRFAVKEFIAVLNSFRIELVFLRARVQLCCLESVGHHKEGSVKDSDYEGEDEEDALADRDAALFAF